MPINFTDPSVAAFIVIPLLLVAAFLWAAYSFARNSALLVGVLSLAWLASTWILAASGIFRQWESTPPPFGLFLAVMLVLACLISFTDFGRSLAHSTPLWALIAVQAFRLPLELAMHDMFLQSVMPKVMSYSGRNFDIVTGATAIVLAILVAKGRAPRVLILAWNILGLGLLLNVVTVAILATPRFRYFGNDQLNTWVTYPPFVWLPGVMVLAALAGHLLIFRALSLQSAAR